MSASNRGKLSRRRTRNISLKIDEEDQEADSNTTLSPDISWFYNGLYQKPQAGHLGAHPAPSVTPKYTIENVKHSIKPMIGRVGAKDKAEEMSLLPSVLKSDKQSSKDNPNIEKCRKHIDTNKEFSGEMENLVSSVHPVLQIGRTYKSTVDSETNKQRKIAVYGQPKKKKLKKDECRNAHSTKVVQGKPDNAHRVGIKTERRDMENSTVAPSV